MNIYEENEAGTLDLDAAAAELRATRLIQSEPTRRERRAEISTAALLDVARSLRVLALEAEGAMLPAASVEYFDGEFVPGQADDGPRDFLLEGDLVHKIDDTEPGEIVALGFDGDGELYAEVEFGGGPVRLYASSLVRLTGDEGRDPELMEAIAEHVVPADVEDEGAVSDAEEAADPDLVDLDPEDLVDDIDADFEGEPHPLTESAVDVLRANEAARKAAKKAAATKKGSKK